MLCNLHIRSGFWHRCTISSDHRFLIDHFLTGRKTHNYYNFLSVDYEALYMKCSPTTCWEPPSTYSQSYPDWEEKNAWLIGRHHHHKIHSHVRWEKRNCLEIGEKYFFRVCWNATSSLFLLCEERERERKRKSNKRRFLRIFDEKELTPVGKRREKCKVIGQFTKPFI